MENNFDLTSFLKKNILLRENIGGYRDITPLKEEDLEEGIDDDSEDPFPSIQKGDSMIFDKGWQYDDDETDEDGLPDEREMFLGQGGQEILDNIKYLIDNGFQLKDIVKQIQQHANYFQNESMEEPDSKKPEYEEMNLDRQQVEDFVKYFGADTFRQKYGEEPHY